MFVFVAVVVVCTFYTTRSLRGPTVNCAVADYYFTTCPLRLTETADRAPNGEEAGAIRSMPEDARSQIRTGVSTDWGQPYIVSIMYTRHNELFCQLFCLVVLRCDLLPGHLHDLNEIKHRAIECGIERERE